MLGGDPDTSMSGRRIARKFAELIARHGQPGMIVSDHGTGLVLNAILAWSNDGKVEWLYRAGRAPLQNSYVDP